MRRTRILHLTSSPSGGIGGVERLLLDMAGHYDRSRVDAWHCNLFDRSAGTGAFPSALKASGLACLEMPGTRWVDLPQIMRRLRRAIREHRFDIVHLHMVHATIIGSVVARMAGGPRVLVTKHYAYRAIGNPVLRGLDRGLTNRADLVVAVSRHVMNDVIANGRGRRETIAIPNGIDLEAFDRAAAEPAGQSAGDPGGLVIASVGNLNRIKGHEYLLRAMPQIVRRAPNSRLVIFGEGAERERLEQLARSLGIADAISLPGSVTNIPARLQQVDLCVQPSLQESFGIALLEAMAAARPVVASAVEGIPEVVVDGTTGLLVPPRDSAAIAEAACSLLEDGDRRTALGRSGRARVAELFNIAGTVRRYEELYAQLVEQPPESALRTH